MPIRVLIVDDSAFMRRILREMLDGADDLQIVGQATNGQEAVEQTLLLRPDVITMDVEMPVMDGVSAVRRIMAQYPTPILMFSSLTEAGAQATLDALDAGAIDFLPKRFEDLAKDPKQIGRILRDKVLQVAAARAFKRPSLPSLSAVSPRPALNYKLNSPYRVLLMGCSTGGPQALQSVINALPVNFPLPVVIIQHMPASFTPTFAQRLDQTAALRVKEAQSGDRIEKGGVFIAPGGRQTRLVKQGDAAVIRIEDPAEGQIYKPCVDLSFNSAAEVYGDKVLAVVLTGMGADGCEGARTLVKLGSKVWAQDQGSCVIYGMPKAVVDAGLTTRIFPLAQLPALLREEV